MAVAIVLSMEGVVDELCDGTLKKKNQNFFGRNEGRGRSVQRTGWRAFVFGIIHTGGTFWSQMIPDDDEKQQSTTEKCKYYLH